MTTGPSKSPTLTRIANRPTRAHATGLAAGLAAAAAIALGASPAHAADCSKVETLLGLSEVAAGFIPKVGTVASAGISIGSTLICDADAPLEEQDILGLIRDEFDDQAIEKVKDDLQNAQGGLRFIADKLEESGENFESFDPLALGLLLDNIEDELDSIRDDVDDFKVPLTTPNNNRDNYDMTPAILLTNYKLTLLQLYAALPGSNGGFIEDHAGDILEDVRAFRTESNRLRDIIRVIDYAFAGNHYTGRLVRDGQAFGEPVVEEPGNAELYKDRVRNELTTNMVTFYAKLDRHDAHFQLIETRAKALLDDPFVSLSTVPRTAPSLPVLLRNASDKAQGDRCLANRKGRLRESGLESGATRMRNCDPSLSHHQWVLRNDGLVQPLIAASSGVDGEVDSETELCLAAKPDKKVLIEPCDPQDPAQIWSRVGDRFRVEIEGAQTCLTPGKNGLNDDEVVARHIPCDDAVDHQRWLAFSPLQSGQPIQPPPPIEAALSVEQAEELAAQVTGGLCVGESSLAGCSRYRTTRLWAHGGDGRLYRFGFNSAPLAIGTTSEADSEVVLVDAPSDAESGAVVFERTAGPNGSVTFTQSGTGLFLFPGAPEPGAGLFLDASLTDEAGEPEGFMFWQHFNGGKFAP